MIHLRFYIPSQRGVEGAISKGIGLYNAFLHSHVASSTERKKLWHLSYTERKILQRLHFKSGITIGSVYFVVTGNTLGTMVLPYVIVFR